MVLFCGRCVSIASFIHFNGMEWNENSKTILYSVQWIWNFHISFLTAAKKRFPISNNVFMKYMRDWITLAAMTTVTVAVALVVSVAVCECSYQRIGGDGANAEIELLYNIYVHSFSFYMRHGGSWIPSISLHPFASSCVEMDHRSQCRGMKAPSFWNNGNAYRCASVCGILFIFPILWVPFFNSSHLMLARAIFYANWDEANHHHRKENNI